jgi:hypothetical protein
MKAKQTETAKAAGVTDDVKITSLKDAGYRIARTGETLRSIAHYVLEQCPKLADDPRVNSHETLRADLAEGYKLRAHELWGCDYYIISKDTGAWLKIANDKDVGWQNKLAEHKGREIKQINVHYVTALTSNEYGAMGKADTAQRVHVEAMRDKWRKYEMDRNSSLIKVVKEILKPDGETTTRTIVSFVDALEKFFAGQDKSAKAKAAKGDATADQVRFRMAVDAFWKVYKKS